MTFDTITDHVEQAKERQVQRWKGKTNEDKIIKIRVARLQLLENILNDVINERAISTASGIQIDGVGENYGEQGERSNRTDAEYRIFLNGLPAKLRQAGQHEVLVPIYKNLTFATRIETEYFRPRAMALYAIVDDVDGLTNESDINSQMQSIRAQGVRLDLGLKQSTESFVFSNSANGNVPANSGFATLTDGSDGGKFIKKIT